MDNDTVIKVEHVSKKYCKFLKKSMHYGMIDIGRNMFGLASHSERLRKGEFWALDDVSFDVKKGETLGIIGANGSGKTTLLKLLNGIFWPDRGRITIKGRVGVLIEVGAGFHPLLTGRENIYLNAAILGMKKKDVQKKFDSIVEFADIGDFINAPVKHYSSGMFVRLGFAVAVHSDPDILLIDEVLAVGDEEFRRKCIVKMNDLQKNGTTIVFVSHSLTVMEGFCSKAIWLDKGMKKEQGTVSRVIDSYLRNIAGTSSIKGERVVKRWGSKEAEIMNVNLLNRNNMAVNKVKSGEETSIIIQVKFNKSISNPIFGIIIKDDREETVYETNTRWQHMCFGTFKEGEEILVTFKQRMQLLGGRYYLNVAVAYSDGMTFCDWQERTLEFAIELPILTVGKANLDSQISLTII
jgi:lipopolysaccharide transport system ATP-binding protein